MKRSVTSISSTAPTTPEKLSARPVKRATPTNTPNASPTLAATAYVDASPVRIMLGQFSIGVATQREESEDNDFCDTSDDEDGNRFLRRVLKKFPNSDLIWRCVVSPPGANFVSDLQVLTNMFKDFHREVYKYVDVVKQIKQFLFDDCGVYYTMTKRGDMDNLQAFAIHQVHTLLAEQHAKEQNEKKQVEEAKHTVNHPVKYRATLRSLQLMNQKMNNLKASLKIRKRADLEDLIHLLEQFQKYIVLHCYSLDLTLKHLESQPLVSDFLLAPDLQEILNKWHGANAPHQTPQKKTLEMVNAANGLKSLLPIVASSTTKSSVARKLMS